MFTIYHIFLSLEFGASKLHSPIPWNDDYALSNGTSINRTWFIVFLAERRKENEILGVEAYYFQVSTVMDNKTKTKTNVQLL